MSTDLQQLILELWANVFRDVQSLGVTYGALDDRVNATWKETARPEIRFTLFVLSCIGANLRYSMWVGR